MEAYEHSQTAASANYIRERFHQLPDAIQLVVHMDSEALVDELDLLFVLGGVSARSDHPGEFLFGTVGSNQLVEVQVRLQLPDFAVGFHVHRKMHRVRHVRVLCEHFPQLESTVLI